MPSFDVVSVVDMQEVDNAVNQAVKEVGQRYDFKGTKTEITKDKDGIKVLTDDDFRLKAVVDVLQSKFVKRGVSLKALQYGKVEPASGAASVRKTAPCQSWPEPSILRGVAAQALSMGLAASLGSAGPARDTARARIRSARVLARVM